METTNPKERPRPGAAALGVAMIIVGGLWLVGRSLDVNVWDYGWPLFVILPGAVLLVAGLSNGGAGGTAAMIPGAIVTTVGLLLLYQDANGHYESWAYAWALVSPGAVGAALWLSGVRNGNPGQRSGGLATLRVGIVLFVVGFFVFEGIIGISDRDLGPVGEYAIPVLIIGLGLSLLVRRR